jgi:Nucleotidyl transferase AbiEii toxin, Type IV TA system
VRDLPRLSVDIDLTYLPIKDRAESLTEISTAMRRISERLKAADKRIRVGETADNDGFVRKLVVRDPTAMVKIEVTPVLRGCVYSPELRQVRPAQPRVLTAIARELAGFIWDIARRVPILARSRPTTFLPVQHAGDEGQKIREPSTHAGIDIRS